MKHYLKEVIEALTVYKTPETILEFIQKQIIIKNPPYGTK